MMRSLIKICMVVFFAGLYAAAPVNADEIRPALLDIKEQNTGLFAVTWKVPVRGRQGAGHYPAVTEQSGTGGYANSAERAGCTDRTCNL